MSSERALLIRTAVDPEDAKYFAVGMDFPSVRVFDTTTGELCCLVEPKNQASIAHSALRSAGALTGTPFAVSLSCLTLGKPSLNSNEVVLAVGMSDGTVLLHNVTRDEAMAHIPVSDTQQGVLAISLAGTMLVCLLKGGKLCIVDIRTSRIVARGLEVQKTASQVVARTADDTNTLDILVSGPTCTLYRTVNSADTIVLERRVSFGSQCSTVSFSWISKSASEAVTCNSQEGVIRVWDLTAAAVVCKRTLRAGHRIGHLRVTEANQKNQHAIIMATTFLGEVCLWDIGFSLNPKVADPLPLDPTTVLMSSVSQGKLLVGDYVSRTEQVVVIRGRFAVPKFEAHKVAQLLSNAAVQQTQQLPLRSFITGDSNAAATASLLDMDNEWASHHAVASRAIVSASEEFITPKTATASSVAQLPVSIEASQRNRKDSKKEYTASIGGVTVPMYQALHAGDSSLVMELLSVSSRTDNDIENCVRCLHMTYLLQLIRILTERMKASSTRSAAFRWVSAILRIRGPDIYELQKTFDLEGSTASAHDAPKHFIAPLLAQYRQMTAHFDKIALAYGRLSIFRSVNPTSATVDRKRSKLVNTETAVAEGIQFPVSYRMIDRGENGNKIVRNATKVKSTMLSRRKRIQKVARKESTQLAQGEDEESESDVSLGSDEMDALLEEGDESMLSLGNSKVKQRGRDKNAIDADEGSSEEDEELVDDEDFDEESDDLVDSDEEAESSEEELDASPYEEDEEEEGDASGQSDASSDDSDADGDDDKEEPFGEEIDESERKATRRVRTD